MTSNSKSGEPFSRSRGRRVREAPEMRVFGRFSALRRAPPTPLAQAGEGFTALLELLPLSCGGANSALDFDQFRNVPDPFTDGRYMCQISLVAPYVEYIFSRTGESDHESPKPPTLLPSFDTRDP
jgi:hypothetical protein